MYIYFIHKILFNNKYTTKEKKIYDNETNDRLVSNKKYFVNEIFEIQNKQTKYIYIFIFDIQYKCLSNS